MKFHKQAFSVVELLVVIVIIGIIATLTVVGYGFVSRDAVNTSIQNDLTNAYEQLDVFNYQNKVYPLTLNCSIANSSTNLCIKVANGSTFSYKPDSLTSPQRYCYSVKNGSTQYYIMNNTTRTPAPGGCVEQSNLVFNYDFANSSTYSGSGTTVNDISGKNNNSVLYNGVSYSSLNNGALSFDGIDDYLEVKNITNTTIRSVEIAYKYNAFNSFYGPLWRVQDWRERIFTDKVQLQDNANLVYSLLGPAQNNNIQYITYSYNGTSIKSYTNGSQTTSLTMTNPMNTGLFDYRIGYQCAGSTCLNINMNLYFVRFYDIELTPTQVSDNFNALRSRYGL